MFKYKSGKVVYYRKERAIYRIEIEGSDEEEEVWIVKKLIKNLSINRKVFVEISGDISAIDGKAIIYMENNPKHRFWKKLEIEPQKIDDINILELQENMWTYFYFFCNSVDWKEFVEMKKVNISFKRGDLAAVVCLRNTENVCIEIGKNYSYYMDDLFTQLQKKNYSIKKKF